MPVLRAQEQDLAPAYDLAQRAQAAQAAGDLGFAAGRWLELLEKYPAYPERAKARHNLGLCQAQLGEFESAISSFQQAINELPAEAVETLAGAHLYLGYCQLELGRRIAATDAAKAGQLFTTATVTLEKLLRKWPEYKGNHEARWYQGSAFEELGRMDEARRAYERVAADAEGRYRPDALYALGWMDQREGEHVRATERFGACLESGPDAALVGEVRLRWAESLAQLAVASGARGDEAGQAQRLKEAGEVLRPVLEDGQFARRDEALFLSAVLAERQGDRAASAARFAEVAALGDSPLRFRAALNAGVQLVAAGDSDAAKRMLELALEAGDAVIAPQAAHELSRLLRAAGDPAAASGIARMFVDKSKAPALQAELLLDQAEALIQGGGDQAGTAAILQRILEEYPDTAAAPLALYNLVWLAGQAGDHATVAERAEQFIRNHSDHPWRPDVEEIRADSLAAQGNSGEAALIYGKLAAEHPDHPRHAQWLVSLAAEQFRAGGVDQAIATAGRVQADQRLPAAIRAHAGFWTGLAEQKAGRLDRAVAALRESLALAPDWPRADEVMAALAVCQVESGDAAGAGATLERLRKERPESAAVPKALLGAADAAFARGAWEQAAQWYGAVRDGHGASPLAVAATAGLAWTRLRQERPDEAASLFQAVLGAEAGTERSVDAARGLAVALRAAGDPARAVGVLRERLAGMPESAEQATLRYELVLALIQAGQEREAEPEVRELLKSPAMADRADRLHYELAWILANTDRGAEAIEEFALIARDYPASAVAADAMFQLGERAYAAGQYAEAAGHYRKSLENPAAPAGVQERAAYKLGWCFYRQKEFEAAHNQFRDQQQRYPDGAFCDDARFMAAESLFADNRFREALESLNTSRAAIETSQRIQPANRALAWLHGAQAANKAGEYAQAISFARMLTEDAGAAADLRLDAWLEIGNAHKELGELEEAVAAWTQATASLGKTGARAWCLLADKLFVDRRFEDAINAYKNVIYGFGGSGEDPAIDPWQAYAMYEASLCYMVQIESASEAARPGLIENATRLLEKLCKEHPGDANVAEARNNLAKLKRLAEGASPGG